jgi:hypothetical protein
MQGTVNEHTNSVKVTIARDNQEAIQFQLDCNQAENRNVGLSDSLRNQSIEAPEPGFQTGGNIRSLPGKNPITQGC